jgi:hypothetical protein
MPAEECVGLGDEERLLPVLAATGEKDELEAIGLRNDGFLGLAVKDDELLTEQRIPAMRSALLRVRSVAVLSAIEWREGWVRCR